MLRCNHCGEYEGTGRKWLYAIINDAGLKSVDVPICDLCTDEILSIIAEIVPKVLAQAVEVHYKVKEPKREKAVKIQF